MQPDGEDRTPGESPLLAMLTAILGPDGLMDDAEERAYHSQDLFAAGALPLAIVRPDTADKVSALVHFCRDMQLALFPRGGGMSYTKAFLPDRAGALILDFSRLARVREINAKDGHVVVEAGCTWAALDDALAPHGLRARFWGPMSGRTATIGGGLSQGSVTFGSGVTGASANAVKSFEIVTGTGAILRTGSDGSTGTGPVNRQFGPDLTGIFANDAGALGIKTAAVLELEPRPARVSGLSFACADFAGMAALMQTVGSARLASELIAMDADFARQNAGPANVSADVAAMWRIGTAAGNPLSALSRMARVALAGRRFLDRAHYTAHFVVEGRDGGDLASRIRAIRALAGDTAEIVNTVPLMTRAMPFPDLPVTHFDGRRMLPVHGLFALSAVVGFHRDYRAWKADNAMRLADAGISIADFFAGVAGAGLLYEPVFYWPDELALFHRRRTPAALRDGLPAHPANPQARALVETLVDEVISLMRRHGSTHFQLGRLYPYASERSAEAGALLRQLKAILDPDRILNPGALEL